jgi:GNAT superfamily N-acetyltransferase
MDTITYHEATPADAQLLTDFRILFSDELAGKQDPIIENQLRESLLTYFQQETRKSYLCWYASVNGKPASVAGLGIRVAPGNIRNPSGRWGYIMSVYTLPEHRGKGLSTQTLNMLIASARQQGINAFELHATQAGEPIYIKNGFILHPEPTYRKFFPA